LLTDQRAFPVTEPLLVNFAAYLGSQFAHSTCQRHLVSLKSFIVDTNKDTTPFSSPRLIRLLKGIKKVTTIKKAPPRKHVTFDIMETIVPHCSKSFDGENIKAAICIAFAGFLRPADFTYEKWSPAEQVSKITRGSVTFFKSHACIRLPFSKTDTIGKGTTITLVATRNQSCPVSALETLFKNYPAPATAPLFGRHHPLAAYDGIYFSRDYFQRELKTLLLSADINPDGFTPHTLRRGAAQSAADAGFNSNDISKLGRWKSTAMYAYVHPETAVRLKRETASSPSRRTR
jgi:integrase